jgi:voltage-gated potassium channel
MIGASERSRGRTVPAKAGLTESFLVPTSGENFGFLRVVRALRLFHSYRLVARLQCDLPFFKRNQEAVFSVVNLFVFVLIMTAVVHASQPEINNHADALYSR